ncbi:MAG TPA: CYTH domain-containing protein [Chloroflexia bacterium]|nr:CYTH domain-containing protein [Chloroflexia bacterium]
MTQPPPAGAPSGAPLEVEAKFRIPDVATFARLRAVTQLGGLHVGPFTRRADDDRYLDTADGRLLAQGWACRVRERDGALRATLKSLAPGHAASAIHSRVEYETTISAADSTTWPPGDTRDRALALSGGQPLQELFRIHQERHVAVLRRDAQPIAELSLDEVHLTGSPPRYGLEAELLPGATPADLAALCATLQSDWGLAIEPESKFEQAWRASGRPLPPPATGSTHGTAK